jgi:hypothetical protein
LPARVIGFVKPEREDKIMKITALYILLGLMLATPVIAAPPDSIPNATLRVTVQQKEDGRINKGFHILELSCWDNQCSLSSVSLNQCMESGSGKKAFYPKVQYSATWMGNLKVKHEGKSLIVQETGSDLFGDYVNNLRFDYEPVGKDKIVNRLMGFSGGYVKNSALLKKVLTTEYVPLPKADQVMKLDCDVLLPGVDKRK